eukprot:maker-scaffold1054_size66621-snap-gene-0.10 protein:Tk00479 transcript:maker-scaffold1054_size66621-snap-gene-0.10-mRNA-1 annotation:"upf0364 protein c6orf211 homolog"
MAIDQNLPEPLSAKFRESFAFPTMKDRVPVIVCKIVDLLYRNKNIYTESDALKQIIEHMSKLRYEIATDKPFSPIDDGRENCPIWNEYMERKQITNEDGGIGEPSWFQSSWLYAECYAYRRLWQSMAVGANPVYKELDFFEIQKRESLVGSWVSIKALLVTLTAVRSCSEQAKIHSDFLTFLKISLWGNKCDLSISSGVATSFQGDPKTQIACLQSNVIVDHSEAIWEYLKGHQGGTVDIILDNVGFELMSDLVLADYLIFSGLAKKIRLRVKAQPWFVSDTMRHDIQWTLDTLEKGAAPRRIHPQWVIKSWDWYIITGTDSLVLDEANQGITQPMVQRWRHFLEDGTWEICEDPFWTYPHFFGEMKEDDPKLYTNLAEATLLIFKGDLNYRKLVGDLKWDPTTSFEQSLLSFHPAPIVTLRTLKADVVTSLRMGQAEELSIKDPDWLINGDWAVNHAESFLALHFLEELHGEAHKKIRAQIQGLEVFQVIEGHGFEVHQEVLAQIQVLQLRIPPEQTRGNVHNPRVIQGQPLQRGQTGEQLQLGDVSEGRTDHRLDLVAIKVNLLERVEAVKVLVHNSGELIAAQVEDAEAGEAPEGADADVGDVRVRDDQDLEEPQNDTTVVVAGCSEEGLEILSALVKTSFEAPAPAAERPDP